MARTYSKAGPRSTVRAACESCLNLYNEIVTLLDREATAMARQGPNRRARGNISSPALSKGKARSSSSLRFSKAKGPGTPRVSRPRPAVQEFLAAAHLAGVLKGRKSQRVAARVSPRLLAEAKSKSGITSATQLLEYALSKVAVEDDYAARLLARKGSVPTDLLL
jgi:hypothetical protein